MSFIDEMTKEESIELQESIFREINKCGALAHAAQKYTELLYDRLQSSIVLCRLFVTQEYGRLPETPKKFVDDLVASAGCTGMLKNKTMILSLLGTQGENPQWNDRSLSKGHSGIPLISSDFVEKIPMMSRLLKALGFGVDWIDNNDTSIIARTVGTLSGIFHVHDAKSETDNRGRPIISEQDFVRRYGVKSVFGLGGGYIGNPLFFVVIIFLREIISRENAQKFILHVHKFKAATIGHVENNMIY